MSASPPPTLGRIDGIPAHDLLEGLGHLHQLVVVTDPAGHVLWTSSALARGLGGIDHGIGHHVSEVCQRFVEDRSGRASGGADEVEGASRISRQLDSMLVHLGTHRRFTNRRIELGLIDGAPVSLEVNAFRVESQSDHRASRDGDPLYVGILRPIVKNEADVPLERTESAIVKAVLNNTSEGLLVVDDSGFIHYASPGITALLGKSPSEMIDRPITVFLPKAGYLISSPPAAGSGSEETLVEVQRSGRGSRWLSVSTRPIALPELSISGHSVHLRDVTGERNQLARLERENAALESYVHSVSHDLRSPLVSLLGFTRLLRQDYEDVLEDPGRHFLHRIEQAGRNMETLIRDLLELSRVDRSSPRHEPVDPRNVLLQILAEIKPRLESDGIALELPDAPPMLHCDRTQLYQIFSNLIGNALQHMGEVGEKFAKEEGRQISVEIDSRSGSDVIVVRDNGRGIPESQHERIFDAFHTVVRSGCESTGIGLAIVKKIALAHEGKAWVESEPDRGTAFFVSLPRR